MNSQNLRKLFLDFFSEKNHAIIDSSPIVVKDDPTLMFNNAGMNQFKDVFTGNHKPKDIRVANSQKCLRVSGKHNDLDEVGHDTYHHTMFEMLGSWSFGDYFKEQAIDLAWEFLVTKCGIEKDRIYVTVFEGDKKDGLSKDLDAYNYWQKYLPNSKIINGNKKDNFWEMGEVGPCGPCSEIHYDNRSSSEIEKLDAASLINKDHPQVIEIWNLVFMQFNRLKDGNLSNLPSKHVDTGMGFERLAMILQEKKSNYDTDIFQPLIKEISKISNKPYGENNDIDIAMRVIADHIRAIAFSIADGQLPSNVKAGYVIRRILRRAVRYGYTFLNLKQPFIYKLVDILEESMGSQYSELSLQKKLISDVIQKEEEAFLRTLEKGLKRITELTQENKTSINGAQVFELYDTYGFPRDLTSLILSENNLTYDNDGFEKAMKIQKERSKKSAQQDIGEWIVLCDEASSFIGYETLDAETSIIKYRKVFSKNSESYHIVLSKNPFYPEGGGQVGDTGKLIFKDEEIIVLDTKRENNSTYIISDSFFKQETDICNAVVSRTRRNKISKNHSVTHLLHESLRKILGEHVIQKGSLVNEDYLRFDFSHYSNINDNELMLIEDDVNRKIQDSLDLITHNNISITKAKAAGALMLFGEKYGDVVRMIEFGSSKELCGGTHVSNTLEIGLFRIKSEKSSSSGVRRIEALSGQRALEDLKNKDATCNSLVSLLKSKDIVTSVKDLLVQNKKQSKLIDEYKKYYFKSLKQELTSDIVSLGKINFIYNNYDLSSQDLKSLAQLFKDETKLVVLLSNQQNNKVSLTLLITNDLITQGYSAKESINIIANEISGGGGGQAYLATAGGTNLKGLSSAVQKARELFTKK